jgi:exosortase/archaeosortase family protein
LTSKCGSYVLDYFGVLHLLSGNLIEIAGKRYFVEEACSGINSLLSVLACTVFYVFWAKAHWLRGILLIAAAIFWVLVANITRVVTIVYFDSRFGIDLLHGWPHAVLGFILFGLVLLLLASTDRLLMFLGTSLTWGEKKAVIPPATPAAEPAAVSPTRRGWSFAVPVAAAYALLVLLQAAGYAAGIGQLTRNPFDAKVVEVSNGFAADTLPAAIGTWQRDPKSGFTTRDEPEMYYADHSRSWTYARAGTTVLLSFDYPYPEPHDLRICYTGTGWTVGAATDIRHPTPDQPGELVGVKFPISRPPSRSGEVWYCSFDQRGAPVEQLGVTEFRWGERLRSLQTSLGRLGGAAPVVRPIILQVQAKTESYLPLSEAEEKDVEQLFLTAAGLIRQKLVDGVAGNR